VDSDFDPDAFLSYPGHQEIEIGLVKLYRLTGEERYLNLAKFFLDARKDGMEYNQSHLPVTEQTEAVGHAVRATYMYSAMADIAALTGDAAYIRALNVIWDDVIGSKLYITGGIGAAGNIEGFSVPYDLPNETAYCETCAGIANVLWNHRMFLLYGDAKYVDVLERTLYNNVLSGISMSGDKFFYPNPLESNGRHQRSEWFACACCPSNICRFIPSVPGYVYAHDRESIYVNLFVSSRADINLVMNDVTIKQNTGIPWEGDVEITLLPEVPKRFALKIRIPGWSTGKPVPSDLYFVKEEHSIPFIIEMNGEEIPYDIVKGFAVIERKWGRGDKVYIKFPIQIYRIYSNEKVEANQGRVALQRGPLVYCIESADYPKREFQSISINEKIALMAEYQYDILNGIMLIRSSNELRLDEEPIFKAIPYYAWAHRGPSAMKVWIDGE
jgi:hypothetical protein